jgi:hypothetical protein
MLQQLSLRMCADRAVLAVALLCSTFATLAREAAPAPPLGWNSWDSYGLTIDEADFGANAQELAKLRSYGWTYAVIDEGWYMGNPFGDSHTRLHVCAESLTTLLELHDQRHWARRARTFTIPTIATPDPHPPADARAPHAPAGIPGGGVSFLALVPDGALTEWAYCRGIDITFRLRPGSFAA